jgi:hypothetical protein
MSDDPHKDESVLDALVDEYFDPERKIRTERERQKRLELVGAMKDVLRTRTGRRIIYWIMERGRPFHDDYNGRSLDMAFAMGQKRICNEVTDLALRANPAIFTQFMEDRLIKEKNDGR